MMTNEQIIKTILDLAHGNVRYADKYDRINIERGKELGVKDFTIQSASGALADLICDLQDFEHELCLNGSMEGASL